MWFSKAFTSAETNCNSFLDSYFNFLMVKPSKTIKSSIFIIKDEQDSTDYRQHRQFPLLICRFKNSAKNVHIFELNNFYSNFIDEK